VTAGSALLFSPGDWAGLAELVREMLNADVRPGAGDAARYSTQAAAARIAAGYDELLGGGGSTGNGSSERRS